MDASKDGAGIGPDLRDRFCRGMVIPAMPLALDAERRFDERHQAALIRYYIDAGAGGLAVGVHTTQFTIREPAYGLFEPVLRYASTVVDDWCQRTGVSIVKIAGICGLTPQALKEARFAKQCGYQAGLVSMSAFSSADSLEQLLAHCCAVAEVLPIIGFYLQPAVGGLRLPYAFWRALAEIDGLLGIKIAPFNRYQTLDVIRAVCDAGRAGEVALYTGNDDHIVGDLVTAFDLGMQTRPPVRIVGGLLGQWAVWTRQAVALLREVHALAARGGDIPQALLARGACLTDANGAIFDVAHQFAGCIPGIHEVLRRQGLLAGNWCLDPEETLSVGQCAEIDRVWAAYPELRDDAFVAQHLGRWLA